MSNSPKQESQASKDSQRGKQAKSAEQGHKSKGPFSTKSAPDNSGKTGSHKSKSS